ncbi:MAG TPA: flagellar hook-associated protein FlgL [Steroidobacteraceae bacterium]|nr:flagellar hook-associated protein FlgL [Steroidobacteraceae bacterium]
MRISTLTFQTNAIDQMDQLEAALSKTQGQLASGKRIQEAADDPAGMAQVNQLNAELSASRQYVTNQNAASANLQLEGQALSDATNLLQSARDLAVEANNASLSASQRQDIATQLQQQLQQLVAIGNRTDANGDYLFSGYASQTQAFTLSGNAVSYTGSDGVSQLQISANQRISGSDAGDAVFMSIPAGNGTFTTAAAAANTGSGSIDGGSVVDPSQWTPDTYTIAFTSPTQYQVTNSGGGVVASGTYTSGDAIQFQGIEVTVSGTPSTGDAFTVAPAGKASAFATLSGLIKTLSSPALSSAQITTQLGNGLAQIDGAIVQLGNVSASVGARLNAVTAAQSTEQSTQTQLQSSVSQLSDVDYAAAVTQLNSQEVALQAAQQSYASLARLSLFNYIQG